MLPNFLGIGFPRSGTTWLHDLLAQHPEVYLPTQRKEIHFFDKYYDNGIAWYEKFFPAETDADAYKVVGEISPEYIFEPEYLDQIAQMGSVRKFVIMLRNPVDRAYSFYGMMVRNGGYSGTFEEFLAGPTLALQRGFYSNYIEEFCKRFERRQLLVLITERAVANVAGTKRELSEFLEISPELFPEQAGIDRVNSGYIPRFPRVYATIVRISRLLRRWDGLIDLVKKLGVKRLFMTDKSLPPMRPETRRVLEERYREEFIKLESMLDCSLDCWRSTKRDSA